jgi:hypothetical protein
MGVLTEMSFIATFTRRFLGARWISVHRGAAGPGHTTLLQVRPSPAVPLDDGGLGG